jgi:outer membrane protein assembly factor BamB
VVLICAALLLVPAPAAECQEAPPAAPAAQAPDAESGPVLSLLGGGGLDLRWTSPASSPLAAAPAFDTQTAYAVTRDGALVAWDLDTGRTRWQAAVATALPVAVGGDLVFAAVTGGVRALRAADGVVAWQREVPGTVAAPPYWDTGWLILSFEGGDLAALRAADGEVLWRAPLGAVAHVPPAPALDNIYFGLADGRTVALALTSGRTVWTRELGGTATGLTALDDQLLVGTSAGALHSVDLTGGRTRWRMRTGAPVVGSAVADEKRIYVIAYDHLLRALDRRSGNLRWRRGLPHRPAGSPVLVAALVLVPSLATELAAYDAATGEPALSVTSATEVAGSTHFRVGGRPTGTRLVAMSVEGQLLAFAPRVEPAPAALGDLPGTAVSEPPAAQPPPAPGPR